MVNLSKLKEPFDASSVRWRVGSTNKKAVERKTGDKYAKPTKGIALCYIDARDVENRLDMVVGAENWSTRYEYHGNTCVCYLTVNGVTKANGSGDTAVEAEKGAISKAFVRAGSSWGIGRYLYNAENVWVDLDEYGKIKKSEYKKLDKMLARISKGEVVKGESPVEEKPKETTVEEKFEVVRKAVVAKATVEELDRYASNKKLLDGVKAIGLDKEFNQMVEDRRNEITGTFNNERP